MVVRWSGREARAVREAWRKSVRADASRLGVAVASVTNWEQRGGRIRLRHETHGILDRDLKQATADLAQDKIADIPVLAGRASGPGDTKAERQWS